MNQHLVIGGGTEYKPVDGETLRRLLAAGEIFWLDLHEPGAAEIGLLRDVFGFHPLALEDSEHFGQRPKAEAYDDFVFLVLYGHASDEDDLVEVHCFLSDRFLVTVHLDECPAFAEVRRHTAARPSKVDHPVVLLHRVMDALVDSFFPLLSEIDDRIDELDVRALARSGEDELHQIFLLKRRLVRLRKIAAPQRDVLLSVIGGTIDLPGMTPERARYFRDVYDHLIRIGELIDTYRDLLTGSLDVYLSTVSNRLNGVMKQLAVMSTIFLPLTFVTGFFGQNFGWLVSHVSGWPAFVGLGIGIEIATLAALALFFRRRGWI